MVGDRLSTDKKLAENAGIDFILVLSGEAKASDLPGLERQPTLVVEHLGQLETKAFPLPIPLFRPLPIPRNDALPKARSRATPGKPQQGIR